MPTSLGPAEILVILVVALMVLGPKRLPEAGRQVGRAIAEVRKWSQGFQDEIRGAIDPNGAPSYPPPVGAPPTTPAPAPPPGPATPAEAEYTGPIPDPAPVADGEAASVPDVVHIIPSTGTATDPVPSAGADADVATSIDVATTSTDVPAGDDVLAAGTNASTSADVANRVDAPAGLEGPAPEPSVPEPTMPPPGAPPHP